MGTEQQNQQPPNQPPKNEPPNRAEAGIAPECLPACRAWERQALQDLLALASAPNAISTLDRPRLERALETAIVDADLCATYTQALLQRTTQEGCAADEPLEAYQRAVLHGLSVLPDEELVRLAESPVLLLLAHERVLSRPAPAWFEAFDRYLAQDLGDEQH